MPIPGLEQVDLDIMLVIITNSQYAVHWSLT